MKNWRLYYSSEKEVGFVPQIIEPVFEGDYTDNNQLWNNYLKQIDNSTIIPKGHLHKRARLTDLMSVGFGAGDLFLSDKLRKIIELYPIIGVQFADTEIITKTDARLKANVIHPHNTDHSFLNIPQCEFQVSNMMGDVVYEILKFNTITDFIDKKNTLIKSNKIYQDINLQKSIRISKLAFKDNADFGICSVFDKTYGGFGFFVSQQLKDDILNKKCTGVIFREINERYP
jgi:hypothetical protein